MKETCRKIAILAIIILIIILGFSTIVRAETGGTQEPTTQEPATQEPATQEPNTNLTDFSKAKFEWKLLSSGMTLEITNVTVNKDSDYSYIISNDSNKPETATLKDGEISIFSQSGTKNSGILYTTDNGLEAILMDKYVELNQDIYLWIIEQPDNANMNISVAGKKMDRYVYPKYAEVFRDTFMSSNNTQIAFNMPWATGTKRNFRIKVGKISNNDILKGIKNNKASSWEDLLNYAKSNNGLLNESVTSESSTYSNNKSALDISKLSNKAYYYLYVVLDDENGKYNTVEGVTLAQSTVTSETNSWGLFFLGDDNFKWENLEPNNAPNTNVNTNTSGPNTLPYTGITSFIAVASIATVAGVIYFKIKNDEYRGI